MTRRPALALLAGICAAPAMGPAHSDDFAGFLQSLWPSAQAQGVRRETFDSLVSGLAPDKSLPRGSGGQPEFEKPLQTYYREAVSGGRITQGRALAATYSGVLASDESRFGVPGPVCVAAWGTESDYGRTQGRG